jgi:hypothetical protein
MDSFLLAESTYPSFRVVVPRVCAYYRIASYYDIIFRNTCYLARNVLSGTRAASGNYKYLKGRIVSHELASGLPTKGLSSAEYGMIFPHH